MEINEEEMIIILSSLKITKYAATRNLNVYQMNEHKKVVDRLDKITKRIEKELNTIEKWY